MGPVMDIENIIWIEKPFLIRPFMILAFSGWADAGEVSTSVLWYLNSRLNSTPFAELKPDNFFVWQTSETEGRRPIVDIQDGMIQSYSFTTTSFRYSKDSLQEHDLIFLVGPEPEQNWMRYASLITDFALEYRVERMILLGGTMDAIPHTAPPLISAVVSHDYLKNEVERYGIELTTYKGPSGIHNLIMMNAAQKDLESISLWSHTPHYIQVVNYLACYAVLQKLSEMLRLKIDLDVARQDSEYLYSQIDMAIAKKPELQEMLKILKTEYQKGKSTSQQAINKDFIKEIEDLFKGK